VSASVGSIVGNGNLVKKVYFPREVLPISVVLANVVNFLLELLVLFLFLAILGFKFYLYLPMLLVVVFIEVMFTIGLCLIFSCLNVYFRDVQHLVLIIMLIWFYVTPVVYPIEMLPTWWSRLPWLPIHSAYKLNPLTALVLCYRNILYYCQFPSLNLLAYSVAVSFIILVLGYSLFKFYEPTFAEEV
jgi:ABC-2 type transport system permease protein